MGLGSIFDRVVPTVIGAVTGGPLGAITAIQGVEAQKRQERRLENQMAYNDPFSSGFGSFQSTPAITPAPQSQGFFSNLGQSLGSFGTGVSQFVQDVAPLTNLFGIGGSRQQMVPQAATTIIKQAPDETSTSGEILGANLGLGANLIQAAGRFARSPGGQGLIGGALGGAGLALSGGSNGQPRITRRMKSDVRRIYNMTGGNPDLTAQILNNMGTYPRIPFDANVVFLILTKRFRNDGPVVTKAAVRKTKTTLRRMKGVVDMYNSVCKPTTRRAPARRAMPKAVQLIKN